jgi:hypothetical protein
MLLVVSLPISFKLLSIQESRMLDQITYHGWKLEKIVTS